MPADEGSGPNDGDRLEHRAEEASGESKHEAISRTNAGLGHRMLQHDDLLAKDDIFGEERGAGLENGTQCTQHGPEGFDDHRGANPITRRSCDFADESRRNRALVRLGTEFLRRTGRSLGRRGVREALRAKLGPPRRGSGSGGRPVLPTAYKNLTCQFSVLGICVFPVSR